MRNIFVTAASFLLIAIVLLSVVPPAWRPVTGVPHGVEHFAIFALAAGALALSFPSRRISLAIALTFFAAAVEVVQLWIPGRHARVSDFVVDTLGAWFSLGLGALFSRRTKAVGTGVESPTPSADR